MNTGEDQSPGASAAAALARPQSSGTAQTVPLVSEGCQSCGATGWDEQIPDESCARCHGTGEYSGIPDAWGRYGVNAVSVAFDRDATSGDQRRLVCVETVTSETTLTIPGAQELITRLYQAIHDVRRQEAECALAKALAGGERPLDSIRDKLGPRAFNCLAREGILTIEQAAAMTDEELLSIVNLGVTTLEQIRSVVGRAR